MDTTTLTAELRTTTGRKVKRLRKDGKLPANVYGKHVDSFSITLIEDDFRRVYSKAGETGIIELTIDSKKTPVLVANVQIHPVDARPLHVDFRAINLKEKVTATVPVELSGESPAEKEGLGTIVQQLSEVEVEALPADLPDALTADVSTLTEVNQSILVKDLVYDKSKVEVQVDPEQLVAKVEPPQEEVAPEPAPVEEAAEGAAVETAEPAAEGEQPKEETQE